MDWLSFVAAMTATAALWDTFRRFTSKTDAEFRMELRDKTQATQQECEQLLDAGLTEVRDTDKRLQERFKLLERELKQAFAAQTQRATPKKFGGLTGSRRAS